jgi:arylsulfatase A-like enzyme
MKVIDVPEDMNRRTFLRSVAVGTTGAVFPTMMCCSQTAKVRRVGAKRPNIVFIIADDMGWADVGYHGSEIETPNIDRLAKEGVRFMQHYVMATCTPTRVGLMTGRYPSRFGVTSPAYGKIFDDDTVTLALALRNSGYTTSITGKWHMGSPPECTPRKYGFDWSYGYFHGQIDPYTHYYKTGVRSWHRNDQYIDEDGHATDLITDEAVRIIESDHAGPFFLYVAYSVPHFPLDEPDE